MDQVIYQSKRYRILEVYDEDFRLNDLKGDCFSPEANPGMPLKQLLKEEISFEDKINKKGVYGYVLEVWNPDVDAGWEHVDSCFGFVGRHSEEGHYIVEEFIYQIDRSILNT